MTATINTGRPQGKKGVPLADIISGREEITFAPATRYFTDGVGTWKFSNDEGPQFRYRDDASWEESGFVNFAEFEESPGDTWEITAEEGEMR